MIEEYVHALRTINTFVVVSAYVPLVIFIYRYARYSNWKATDIGRTIMYQKIAFVAIISLSLMSYIVRGYVGVPIIQARPDIEAILLTIAAIVYLSMVGLFWRTYVNLLLVQKRHPDEKRKEKDVRQSASVR